MRLVIGKREFDFSQKTLIMGILNVTPDSFYDGGRHYEREDALEHARKMILEKVDVIDVGGESTRPGSKRISAVEELNRILPVVNELAKVGTLVSVDTYKAEVARQCLQAGARMINDVTSLQADKKMVEVIASAQVPVVLMHMQGNPESMQLAPHYEDVVKEVYEFFEQRVYFAERKGIDSNKIILDPGIGFGKNIEHNLELLRNLEEFKKLGKPLMVGVSRKSFIGKITGLKEEERLEGSIAAACYSVMHGADIVRVHDVLETRKALQVIDALRNKEFNGVK